MILDAKMVNENCALLFASSFTHLSVSLEIVIKQKGIHQRMPFFIVHCQFVTLARVPVQAPIPPPALHHLLPA